MKNLITEDDIPAHVRELFSSIKGVADSAVLAGGYLRDLDNGRQPKDIDIFVSLEQVGAVLAKMEELGFIGGDVDESADGDISVVDQYSFETDKINIEPVNIIVAKHCTITPYERFQRFDFGICQIAYDGLSIIVTDNYTTDKENKEFRVCRNPEGKFHLFLERYLRIGQRYQGWGLRMYDPLQLLAPILMEGDFFPWEVFDWQIRKE